MMVNKPLISVVVPIYKVESYLRDCIDSILAQTLSDIEVLLVDDGSPDNCGAICDEYAEKDERVRVVHKENGGVSMARKTGVDNARADWITFVDGDDTLPCRALENLYDAREGSDIIIGRHDGDEYEKEYLTPEEYRSCVILKKYMIRVTWGRLIARSLFDANMFPPRYFVCGQDALTNLSLAFANKKPVRLLSKKVYNYNIRPNSVSHLFRSCLEYEEQFSRYVTEIIPVEQRALYAKECVFLRLSRLELLYIAYKRNVWYGTPYYRETMEQAKRCGYRIPLSLWVKVRTTNTTLLRLFVSLECFLTYRYGQLKNKLTRRKTKG